MNVNEMTNEEIGRQLLDWWYGHIPCREVADARAALGKFARELLAPPLRQDVPSVEKIGEKMRQAIVDARHSKADYVHCARVAHRTMLELQKPATEARTMIQGMTVDEISEVIRLSDEWQRGDISVYRASALVTHRLANTPAVEAKVRQHTSDCAVHNMPAYPAGPCDCGAVVAPQKMLINVMTKPQILDAISQYAKHPSIAADIPPRQHPGGCAGPGCGGD
jgi:hypothetical protein